MHSESVAAIFFLRCWKSFSLLGHYHKLVPENLASGGGEGGGVAPRLGDVKPRLLFELPSRCTSVGAHRELGDNEEN